MSKENIVNEIHRNARKKFPRRHVVMKDIDDLWQADLIDMQSVYKDNKNYKYIFKVCLGISLKTKEKRKYNSSV